MNEEPMPADQAADAPDTQPPTPDAAPGDAADAPAMASMATLAEEPDSGTEPEGDAETWSPCVAEPTFQARNRCTA